MRLAALVITAGGLHLVSHIEDRALGGHPSTDIPGLAFLCVTLAAAIVLEARAPR
jgi:hypothetical protein